MLYIKAHRSKKGSEEDLPGDRTIFVANADCGEAGLREVFEKFGEVQKIAVSKFHDGKRGGMAEWLPAFHDVNLKDQKEQVAIPRIHYAIPGSDQAMT